MVEKHFGIDPSFQNSDGFSYRDLQNTRVLYDRGITSSYVELCFITNQENMDYFKTNYDEVASDIIEVISGSEVSTPPTDPDPNPEPEPVMTPISDIQTWLNDTYAAGLDVDNDYGPLTVSAVIRGIQTELNAQLGANIPVDGSFGPATQAAWDTVRFGSQGNFTQLIQAQLIGLGYNVNGFDGNFGQGLYTAVQSFQNDYGLEVDGRVGPATAYSLFNALEGADDSNDSTPTLIHEVQQWLNNTYNTGLELDGSFGPATSSAVIIGVQTELNAQLGVNIPVDGSFGPATQAAWDTVRFGSQGNLTQLIQAQLIGLGYNVNGFDGNFGQGLYTAVQSFQSDYGLEVDGRVGPATAYTLFNQ